LCLIAVVLVWHLSASPALAHGAPFVGGRG
jgi:hypothetical protein